MGREDERGACANEAVKKLPTETGFRAWQDMADETGRQYPMLDLFDWLGTSETMLGIHRRFRASDGVQASHWQRGGEPEHRAEVC